MISKFVGDTKIGSIIDSEEVDIDLTLCISHLDTVYCPAFGRIGILSYLFNLKLN